MLTRYTLSPMDRVWSEAYKYEVWRHIEITAATAKGAPLTTINYLLDVIPPSLDAIADAERRTKHDVMAFLVAWRAGMPDEHARWVHKDMTSSDLVDSANAFRIKAASKEIDGALRRLLAVAASHALAFWDTPRLARTHGQPAEATTWGYRVADFVEGLRNSYDQFVDGTYSATAVKLSGPVGNYRYTSIDEEFYFAFRLGLHSAPTATQIVNRAHYADWIYALSRIATIIESFALEVRLSQRWEVSELAESFTPGQTGSSAMPHKRNPIVSENLTGLARLVRAQLEPILEGVASHHERDISHSSVERIALPTASTLTHYMVVRCTGLIENLHVATEIMQANLDSAGDSVYSAWTKSVLSKLMHPDEAWQAVHNATPPWGPLPDQPPMRVGHVRRYMEYIVRKFSN